MKTQEKLIKLEGYGEANILVQWGTGKVVIATSASALALNPEALDTLIDALLEARTVIAGTEVGPLGKLKREALFVRVPADMKARFVEAADRLGLSQNTLAHLAIREFLDR